MSIISALIVTANMVVSVLYYLDKDFARSACHIGIAIFVILVEMNCDD